MSYPGRMMVAWDGSGARKRWNQVKDAKCADAETGQPWWPEISYGSRLVVADRFYPSSKTCCACGHAQDIGWAEHWTCTGCGVSHQRGDNAAVNLARCEPPATGDSAVGPAGAVVRRRAGRKTGPRPAGGDEARKGRGRTAAEQPQDGVPA